MRTDTHNLSRIGSWKKSHLAICTDRSRYPIEGKGAGFEAVHFIHHALPEVSLTEVDAQTDFLGAPLPVPFFISCMTRGSKEGPGMNRVLAEAAQKWASPWGWASFAP